MFKNTGEIVMKENYEVWTEVSEIEELEPKTALSGSWDVCPN